MDQVLRNSLDQKTLRNEHKNDGISQDPPKYGDAAPVRAFAQHPGDQREQTIGRRRGIVSYVHPSHDPSHILREQEDHPTLYATQATEVYPELRHLGRNRSPTRTHYAQKPQQESVPTQF